MSRYEWERGEFKIPSAEWASFKTAVREAVNRHNASAYDTAVKLHERVLASAKGRKPFELRDIAFKEMSTLNAGTYYSPAKFCEDEVFEIVQAVVQSSWNAGKERIRLRKPMKKDFPQHGNNITSYRTGECSLELDNGSRTATWRVDENNHAVDRARETALAKAMFAALKQVKWTRDTGGVILGNDEYNRDAGRDYEGGGGSYSKERFGPQGPGLAKPAQSIGGWGFRR